MLLLAAAGIVALTISATSAPAVQLELPLNIDYLLSDAAVKQRVLRGTERAGAVVEWSGNCVHFYAINPHFSRSGANVQLESQGDFEAAIPLGEQSVNATSWGGNLIATSVPWITGFTVKFRVIHVNFYGNDGSAIAGDSFPLIKSGPINDFGDFSYDLRLYLQTLQAVTEELPTAPASSQLKAVLASLRRAPQVVPQEEGIDVALRMDVPESWLSPNVMPMTAAQKASWQEAAENVWRFLTTMATQTQALISDPQLRSELAAVATDTRSRIAAAEDAPSEGGDPRPLFRDDWQRLRLALTSAAGRGSLGDQTTQVLAALTAGDLIFELDRRAPGLGSQLSRAGLEELAPTLAAPRPPARY